MAGEWIKVQNVTPDKPEVWQIADALGMDPDAVFGKLFRVWAWFDEHTEDGNAPAVTKTLLDRQVGVSGFCDAVIAVGWMHQHGDALVLPNFDRHNGKTAKNRALTARRVAKHKADTGNDAGVSGALPREEKRRVVTPLPPSGDAYTSEFDAFWSTYPNRKNKSQAFKAWKKLAPAEREAAREDVGKRRGSDPDWLKDGGKFVPMGSTYLNGKRWEDDWSPASTQGRTHREL